MLSLDSWGHSLSVIPGFHVREIWVYESVRYGFPRGEIWVYFRRQGDGHERERNGLGEFLGCLGEFLGEFLRHFGMGSICL